MLRGPETSDTSGASLGFLTREYGDTEQPYLSVTYAGLTATEQEILPTAAVTTRLRQYSGGSSVGGKLGVRSFLRDPGCEGR